MITLKELEKIAADSHWKIDRVSLEGTLEAPFKPATPYEEITTNEAGIAGLKAIDDACEPYGVQFVGQINFKFKRGGMAPPDKLWWAKK